jgi:drug/metabolite transporter (DMT)-like permease
MSTAGPPQGAPHRSAQREGSPVSTRDQTLGLWLGVLGVAMFAVTLPMTRLATGSAAAPQLSPWFVTLGRAALAGGLSVLFLLCTRSPWPQRRHLKPLLLAVLGNAIGYPLLLAFALRQVTASHAAVITALLPLATAAIAAAVMRQRAPLGFWLCAAAGSVLVLVFSLLRAQEHGGFGLQWADLLLVLGVIAASLGYVYGAQVTPELGAERVICWVCVLALPVSLPALLWLWPQTPVAPSAWAGFVYVGVFSMWIGFFAWYRGLALGGALRVSQTQLLQPFLSIVASMPLLGEPIDAVTLVFAVAVVATVVLGKNLAHPAVTASSEQSPESTRST